MKNSKRAVFVCISTMFKIFLEVLRSHNHAKKKRKHSPKTYHERIKGLWIHLVVFLIVNAGLTTLNLLRNSEKLWFYWPLLGWGFGLVLHSAVVYRRRHLP